MSIARVTVSTHCNDLGGRAWNPALVWTRKYAVFVELTDDTGRTGLGECWCFDTAPDTLVAFLRTEVAPGLTGLSPEALAAHLAALRRRATLTARHGLLESALSGVECAAADLAAQAAGLPLWRSLAPEGPGRVRLYGSGGLYGADKGPEALAAEMAGMAASGFDIVKMKVGGLAPAADLERVQAVLEALPPATRLIIDGVYTYEAETALALWRALPAERMEAFQSPVPAADHAGMRRLTAEGVPVMAVEAEYRPEIHESLIETRAVRFLQVAPIACGGPSRVLALAGRLRGTGIALSLEVSSTAVATLAAAHLAAASEAIAHVEFHTLHQVFFDRLPAGWAAPGPRPLPETPGLGLALAPGMATPAFTLSRTGPQTAGTPDKETSQ
ncbi:mandelate racemase/muconate lactonizing enzyme family protein [Oceanicella sp. SM1341]|uniref:mandelate racemase/muconate lactonizing enzyme family protein n=1 Tax=Oceanicella sp. SM1341 TaxID=1548889 RepID=UPI000E4A7849|nr:enolase C-terminal domain-like protein [Oceanicella sp. SM1341]